MRNASECLVTDKLGPLSPSGWREAESHLGEDEGPLRAKKKNRDEAVSHQEHLPKGADCGAADWWTDGKHGWPLESLRFFRSRPPDLILVDGRRLYWYIVLLS